MKYYLRKIYRKLQAIFGQIDFVPSGHFYSPIANNFEIQEGLKNLKRNPSEILGIDLNLASQRKMLEIFKGFYDEMPFKHTKQENLRYYFDNPAYCHSDGICLYSMIRFSKPKRIIEVGSGYSSALMHDVNEKFFKMGGGRWD